MSHRDSGLGWDRPWPPGWHVTHVAETGSTNADLLANADRLADRSVLATDHQTAGRGRLDRRWDAPPGANLLASLLFRGRAGGGGELVRRVSLATLDACRRLAPEAGRPALKWPNDLLLDDVKCAGVLAQANGAGDVVVGLGLNVGWAPEGAARLGDDVDRPDLLAELLAAFDRLPPDGADLHTRYRAELGTIGRPVRVERADGTLVGRAIDVDPDGRLVVLDDCAMSHRVDVGDVVHLRAIE